MTVTDLSGNGVVGALIDELTCPYCGEALAAERGVEPLEYGVLTCGCGEVPVVNGIVWLSRRHGSLAPQDDPVIRRVLAKLRAGDHVGALCEALLPSFQDRYRKTATALERIGQRPPEWLFNQARPRLTRKVLSDDDLNFASAAALLRNGPYATYLHHRFANPSLLAALPLIMLLRDLAQGQRGRVLDIGGGCGHASFLINRYFPELQVILADGDFGNLYLARRFVAPRALCLCMDAEARIPLQPMSLDAVFCLDAFHYIREKVGLVEELRRTVRPDGLWLFPHLHNARASNPTPGYPLSPRGYVQACSGLGTRLVSEETVLRTFQQRKALDLTGSTDDVLSTQTPAVTLIGGPDSLWQEHDFTELCQRVLPDLNFNTVYDFSPLGVGALEWPTAELRRECLLAEEVLDPEPVVDPRLLTRLRTESLTDLDRQDVLDLVRNFVLVPMPPGYR